MLKAGFLHDEAQLLCQQVDCKTDWRKLLRVGLCIEGPLFRYSSGGAVRGGRNNIYNNNYNYTYNNNINDMKIIISFRPAAL